MLSAEENEAYREAMAEDATEGEKYRWTATQNLSLAAWLERGPDPEIHGRVTHLAKAELLKARDPSREAGAHGTIAELTLEPYFGTPFCRIFLEDLG